jgi:hypothetical protein
LKIKRKKRREKEGNIRGGEKGKEGGEIRRGGRVK